jgi:hypothetical protein
VVHATRAKQINMASGTGWVRRSRLIDHQGTRTVLQRLSQTVLDSLVACLF